MLALLVLVVAALAGALFMQATGAVDLSTLPALPIAGAVLAALVLLYVVAVRSDGAGRRFGGLSLLAAALLAAVLAAGAWLPVTSGTGLFKSLIGGGQDGRHPALRSTASVCVRKQEDGKFALHATLNGQAADMILDTGAVTVVLKHSDATAAGIDPTALSFDTPLRTANGTSYLAPARIKALRVGPIEINDVEALVAKPGTVSESLLGMSFLKRLASYEISGDFVTLRQ